MADDEIMSEPTEQEMHTAVPAQKKARKARAAEESLPEPAAEAVTETAEAAADAVEPEPSSDSAPPKQREPNKEPKQRMSSGTAQVMRFSLKPHKRR